LLVIVTEKPSVAKDLASYLKATKQRQGYFEGPGIRIAWALGHLVALKEPQEYKPEWKKWSLKKLPLIPSDFQLKSFTESRKQLHTVELLIRQSTRLICATDAGREGELIFRNILRFLGIEKKPFERLWLSSLTPEAIKAAFDDIKPGSAYNNLYFAAKCRSEADWIVGINGTRNLTVRYGKEILWSMGRVQTPVLAMIADRDDEIATFSAEAFWELYTEYNGVKFRQTEAKFIDKEKANDRLKAIASHPFFINNVRQKREKRPPPLLFNLTELQREMNRLCGFSATKTLSAAQMLYESKYITYPRTDSQYLSEDMRKTMPNILNNLATRWDREIARLNTNALVFTSRMFNQKKVTDHHAIIPTGRLPQGLPLETFSVFEAIVRRLIAGFYPVCEKDVTQVDGSSNGFGFRAQGFVVLHPGWTVLYPLKVEEKSLPPFIKGESGPHKPFIKEGKTSPPKPYSENSLLGAMATAGKQIHDEQVKEVLKERGLGTAATRAAIIDTLIGRHYVKREGKALRITPLGRYLIALIQDPQLKSAELTGKWEAKLKKIEKGELKPAAFMEEIIALTQSFLLTSDIHRINTSYFGFCPLCGRAVIQGKKGYGCSHWKKGCLFVLSNHYKGIDFTSNQIRLLLQRGLLVPVCFPDGTKKALTLTSKGKLLELALPQASQQKRKRRKRAYKPESMSGRSVKG